MQLKICELDGDAIAVIYDGSGTVYAKSLAEIALTLSYLSDENIQPSEDERRELKIASLVLYWLAENATKPIAGNLIDETDDEDELSPTPTTWIEQIAKNEP